MTEESMKESDEHVNIKTEKKDDAEKKNRKKGASTAKSSDEHEVKKAESDDGDNYNDEDVEISGCVSN